MYVRAYLHTFLSTNIAVNTSRSDGDSALSGGEIAGIIIAGIAVIVVVGGTIIIIIITVFFLYRKNHNKDGKNYNYTLCTHVHTCTYIRSTYVH